MDTSFKAFRNTDATPKYTFDINSDLAFNGKILLKTEEQSQFGLIPTFIQLEENGSRDLLFSVTEYFGDMFYLPDGKIVAKQDSGYKSFLFRMHPNGKIDSGFAKKSFGLRINDSTFLTRFSGFYKGRSGRFFLTQSSYMFIDDVPGSPSIGSAIISGILRLNTDLTIDTSLHIINHPGGLIQNLDEDPLGAISTVNLGYVYFGGSSHNGSHFRSNGSSFGFMDSFGIPSFSSIKYFGNALAFSPSGTLAEMQGGPLTSYCQDGNPDPSFEAPITSYHGTGPMLRVDSNTVLVGGDFNHVNGKPISNFFRMFYRPCVQGINSVKAKTETIQQPFIYPNPGKDQFTISGHAQFSNLWIYDAKGQMFGAYKNDDNKTFSTKGLANGIYFIRFISSNKSHCLRWVKE